MEPDLTLEDAAPFRLSRNHFSIEKRDGSYHVRDLWSTLGTIVNGEPIGDHFRADDGLLRNAADAQADRRRTFCCFRRISQR